MWARIASQRRDRRLALGLRQHEMVVGVNPLRCGGRARRRRDARSRAPLARSARSRGSPCTRRAAGRPGRRAGARPRGAAASSRRRRRRCSAVTEPAHMRLMPWRPAVTGLPGYQKGIGCLEGPRGEGHAREIVVRRSRTRDLTGGKRVADDARACPRSAPSTPSSCCRTRRARSARRHGRRRSRDDRP